MGSLTETPAQKIEIRSVESDADFRAFFEFPWEHYRDDPNWVPPLLSMRRELLDRKKNPAWEYMEGQYFCAWRGDTLVGTITAFINHRHNETWNERVGWFGTFETINDQAVADALLTTACDWVRERGYSVIQGPQSFTTHEETGLLVDGFTRPVLLTPYNPPYYQTLIENAGFIKQMDMLSMYYHRNMEASTQMRARLKKIADRAKERSNITIRPFEARNKAADFRLFRDLYNRAWDANWGFVPMTDRELDALIESLGMFVEPNMAFFALVDGDPAGFTLAVPDFNEMLQKAYPRPGVPEIFTLLQVLWQWKVARTTRGIRLPLMGVVEEHRDKGIDLVLLSENFDRVSDQYQHIDCGWVLETNQLTRMSLKLGADPYKTHRIYQKTLTLLS